MRGQLQQVLHGARSGKYNKPQPPDALLIWKANGLQGWGNAPQMHSFQLGMHSIKQHIKPQCQMRGLQEPWMRAMMFCC